MVELPEFIRFGRAICGELDQAERREWWLANGLGGYAAGTIAGSLTRRYHGLLIAPLYPPLGRRLLFTKADATLIDEEAAWPLFTNRWADGAIAPGGYVHIESFHLKGRMPVWHFALGDRRLEVRIWMEPEAHTTHIAYRLLARARCCQLRVKLLINEREHHSNTRSGGFAPTVDSCANQLIIGYGAGSCLYLTPHGGSLHPDYTWYENFHLAMEAERGLDPLDNHLCIGQMDLDLVESYWTGLTASLAPGWPGDLQTAMQRFCERDRRMLETAQGEIWELTEAPGWAHQLVLASDSFLFKRSLPGDDDCESVIAGYPWFGDWGRDTMIALPGLTLATGRYEHAQRILQSYTPWVDQGLLPNVLPVAGERAEYNSVDAALWFIEAWRSYVRASGDVESLCAVFPVLEGIIHRYRCGTRFEIACDGDGLLWAGKPDVQLTWMDARVDGRVVTPRIGKPVEVNALWFNALCSLAELAEQLPKGRQGVTSYREWAQATGTGFQRFIRSDGAGLYDVLDGPEEEGERLRPNQLLAVSLAHSPLDDSVQRQVLVTCSRELLCSYGLRSLAPTDSLYHPRYQGNSRERDSAYHQGTVWGWLLGHYALAHYRVHGDAGAAQAFLEPLHDHLFDAGLGTVSEIFDGAPPHHPRGAPSQAWSVSCILAAWIDLERTKRGSSERYLGPKRAEEDHDPRDQSGTPSA